MLLNFSLTIETRFSIFLRLATSLNWGALGKSNKKAIANIIIADRIDCTKVWFFSFRPPFIVLVIKWVVANLTMERKSRMVGNFKNIWLSQVDVHFPR